MSRFELLLMRHGQAEDYADGGDPQRRLTETGHAQAALVGRALIALDLMPTVVVASPFRRAQETARGVTAPLGIAAERIEPAPMLTPSAPPATTIDRLVAAATAGGDDMPRVLAVGHNPSITTVLGKLVCGDTGIHFSVATADLAHLYVQGTGSNTSAVVLGYYPSVALSRLAGS